MKRRPAEIAATPVLFFRRQAMRARRRTALLGLAFLGACAGLNKGNPGQPPRALIVNNRSSYEVIVYALPSPGTGGNRLGSAGSVASTTFKVAQNTLQTGETLMIRLHPVGTTQAAHDWVSPAVLLYSGLVA